MYQNHNDYEYNNDDNGDNYNNNRINNNSDKIIDE